jgi:cytochrome P450
VTEVFDYQAGRGKTPFDPPPRYEQLREHPMSKIGMWDGSRIWLATRDADVRAVLGDERFSADNRKPGFPLVGPGCEKLTEDNPTFGRMDPPEHGRLRHMVAADFTKKRAVALRPQIQQIVDRLADGMLAKSPPADLVAEFALPMPSQVICLILGVPYEEHGVFQKCTAGIINAQGDQAVIEAASEDLSRFLAELVENKARRPADDLLSRLVVEQERRGELSREDIIGMARLLLVAGHETTSMQIALGMAALLYHPAQLAALRDDPAQIPGAVEELLRYLTIFLTGLPRTALSDVEIGGQRISAGEGVMCYLPAANRDSERFEAPEVLDVTRNSRSHLAFGFGLHRCLGAPLAKVEMEVAFETLIRRFPMLRLGIDFDQVRFRQAMLVYGVFELPVIWQAD